LPRPKSLAEAQSRRTPRPGPPNDVVQLLKPIAEYREYDRNLSLEIQRRWHAFIEGRKPLPKGIVEIRFKLQQTGKVIDIETVSTTVSELFTEICRQSVEIPDLKVWPDAMRKQLAQDHRQITVSFHY